MTAQVAADLRAAADLLDREGWTQERFYDYDTGCRCVAGALRESVPDGGRWAYTVEALARHVGVPPFPTSIYDWNDDSGRTADEVIAALRAAADAAEQQA